MTRRNDAVQESDESRMQQLELENAELRKLVEQTEEQGAKLADRLTEARQTIAGLQNRSEHQGEGLRWFFAELWSFPQSRLALLIVVVSLRIALYVHWFRETEDVPDRPPEAYALLWHFVFGIVALLLLCKWAEAEYRTGGGVQLFLKSSFLMTGLMMVFVELFGTWWPDEWFRLGLENKLEAFVLLALTVLLAMSKFTERLREKTSEKIASMTGFVPNLIGWFL